MNFIYFVTLTVFLVVNFVEGVYQVGGFNARSLTNDSDYVPPQKDIVRVYGTRFCPFTHRMLLILASKNISAELVSVNTKNPPAWYREKISEERKIPCVEYNEKIVCGSVIAGEYLDDEFRVNSSVINNALPKDPFKRAKQKMLFQKLEHAKPADFLYKALYFRVGDHRTFGSYEIEAERYEAELTDNFLAGPEPGWIDYMLWPHLEKIEMVPLVFKNWAIINKDPPKFVVYLQRMQNRPEIRAVQRPPKLHLKYLMSVLKDQQADLDIGI
nr:glutathione S transferase omega 3 [Diamesa zernyi]